MYSAMNEISGSLRSFSRAKLTLTPTISYEESAAGNLDN